MGKQIVIDDDTHDALLSASRDQGLSVDEFINRALRDWLLELQDDVRVAQDRIAEYDRTGESTPLEHVLKERGLKYE